jgi:quinol-cytochrome oxidoreductase complex cytochrome b subunit
MNLINILYEPYIIIIFSSLFIILNSYFIIINQKNKEKNENNNDNDNKINISKILLYTFIILFIVFIVLILLKFIISYTDTNKLFTQKAGNINSINTSNIVGEDFYFNILDEQKIK